MNNINITFKIGDGDKTYTASTSEITFRDGFACFASGASSDVRVPFGMLVDISTNGEAFYVESLDSFGMLLDLTNQIKFDLGTADYITEGEQLRATELRDIVQIYECDYHSPIENAEAYNKCLSRSVFALESHVLELTEAFNTVKVTAQELDARLFEIHHGSEVSQKESELQECVSELEEELKDAFDNECVGTGQCKRILRYKERCDELSKDLEEYMNQCDDLSDELETANDRIEELESGNEALCDEIRMLREENERLASNADLANEDASELREENRRISRNVDMLEEEIAHLRQDIPEEGKEETNVLRIRVRELEKENAEYFDEISDLRDEIRNLKALLWDMTSTKRA